MTLDGVLAVVCAAGAAVSLMAPSPAGARVRAVVGGGAPATSRSSGGGTRVLLRSVAPWCAALAAWSVIGGRVGVAAGLVAGVVTPRVLSRLTSRQERVERDRVVADLPTAACLMAVCLRSGRAVAEAVGSVASALGGPLGSLLDEVAAGLELGAEPANAWRPLTRHPATAAVGRTFVRSLESGAPVAEAMDRLADAARLAARAAAVERARSVGVQAALPLGLCFLPAFVVVGLVPVIASALSSVIAGLR